MGITESTVMSHARLLVFFEGTANTLLPRTTQVGYFYQEAEAVDISDAQAQLPTCLDDPSFKMGFDGCGITNGMAGTIWACGLASQVDIVIDRVHAILEHYVDLTITVLGLSRGGIAALLLAKALASKRGPDTKRISLNLCLFDPVPGNLINTARYLDVFSQTVANSIIDVRPPCDNIACV